MIEYQSKSQEELPGTKPTIAVVGIGGAGANVLDRIALEGLADAELISMNSDVRALANSVAPTKIQLGKMLTQGLGAGGDPDLGRDAAMASMEEIRDALRGKDLVFLCSGQGGGIGSGAAPLVAQAAKEHGAFVVVFATMPFCFEGKRRLAQARQSLEMYRGVADALITFDNDRMGELILPKEGIQQAFAAADQIISQSIRAVTSLVTHPGLIHIGMDDLISALRNNDSRCLFGYGAAKGQNRAQEALKRALKSPLLDRGKLLEKSKNLLVHISGGESMTLYEVELLMNALEKHVPESTQILFGASSDKSLGDSLCVTLISSLTSVEMGGKEVSQHGEVGQQQQYAEGTPQYAAAGGGAHLASGDSIIRSAPMTQQPVAQHHQMVQQPVVQRPLAEVSAQAVQRAPEIVEPPLTPPPAYPPSTYQQPHPQTVQPVSYAQPGSPAQPSTASGLGKSFEPVPAAPAAVESAQESSAEIAQVETAEQVEETQAPEVEAVASVAIADATTPPVEAGESAQPDETAAALVSVGAVPAPDELDSSQVVGDEEEEEAAVVEAPEAIVEISIPADVADETEAEEEAVAESDEEAVAEVEEEAVAESEEEAVAEVEEEAVAEAEEEAVAESEEEAVAEVEEEEVIARDTKPVVVRPKGLPQTVVLKPVAKQELSPAAKVEVPVKSPAAESRPKPAVDMASALAEVQKSQEAQDAQVEHDAEPEPMGTMGPAAALGLKAAPQPSGPSADSVGRPTVTAGDPRTGKQQMLELEPIAKGRFDKAEPTVVDGEDLDIPTFLRKKGNYT